MVWWPPKSLVIDSAIEPPDEWEPWKRETLKRMQAKYQSLATRWIPTIEARRRDQRTAT